MHSSTSSSDTVCLQGPWLKTWLLAIGLTLAVLGGWELTLRRMGHRPNVIDDEALWAGQRDRVYTRGGEKPIVLIGDCRTQLGLVPTVLRDSFAGRRVVQLAVEGSSPIATLRDLAADEAFNGTVICGLDARLLCRDLWDTQQHYVDYYHRQYGLNQKLNRFFSTLAQEHVVSIDPQLRLNNLLVRLATGQPWPAPYYLRTQADRSRLADYSRVDLEAHRKWACDRTTWLATNRDLPWTEEWLQDAMEVEPWVDAIVARGGRVVFVQFPTTGHLFAYDEAIFPKEKFWDAFAARTSALCIHFKDVPELAAFDCPDWSHLDRTDALRFTTELGRTLADRELLGTMPGIMASGQPDGKPENCHCNAESPCQKAAAECPCCGPHSHDPLCLCEATSKPS